MRDKIIFTIGILTIPLIIYNIYNSFNTINNIPKGYYITSLDSHNGDYTLKSYWIYDSFVKEGATRVEVVNNKTNKIKNIYYNYPENKVKMEWINENTIKLNNIKLNIHKNTYDWRKKFRIIKKS